MPKPMKFWIDLSNAFIPDEVLAGQRGGHFYCEREHSPIDDMRIDFRKEQNPIRPPIAFFTGHRGSGKSSMLIYLLDSFKKDFFVVYFDINHNLDSNTVNQIDILYLLGATIFKAAMDEGLALNKENLKELKNSIYKLTEEKKETTNFEVDIVELVKGLICFGANALGAPFAEKLTEAALNPFSFTSGVSTEIARKRETEPLVQNIINNINLIIADVETNINKDVLVVVDGIDKLQDFDQAESIFLSNRALTGPLCRIIYTVPMIIYNHPNFDQLEAECKSHLLPNVKLYEKTDSLKYETGYKTMREVVMKRVQVLDLKVEDVFEEDALNSLIEKSGGVMRWFIGLVQDSCKAAEQKGCDKIDLKAAGKAIDDRIAQLSGRLTIERIRELRQVRIEKRLSGNKITDELLHGLLIVAYRNRTTWFDAHPLIWEEL